MTLLSMYNVNNWQQTLVNWQNGWLSPIYDYTSCMMQTDSKDNKIWLLLHHAIDCVPNDNDVMFKTIVIVISSNIL